MKKPWWFKPIVDALCKFPNAPKELIYFDARGCMAQDWREVARGVVIDKITRADTQFKNKFEYYVVQKKDGSLFEVFAGDVLPGTIEMQKFTENPDESLVGKLVVSK